MPRQQSRRCPSGSRRVRPAAALGHVDSPAESRWAFRARLADERWGPTNQAAGRPRTMGRQERWIRGRRPLHGCPTGTSQRTVAQAAAPAPTLEHGPWGSVPNHTGPFWGPQCRLAPRQRKRLRPELLLGRPPVQCPPWPPTAVQTKRDVHPVSQEALLHLRHSQRRKCQGLRLRRRSAAVPPGRRPSRRGERPVRPEVLAESLALSTPPPLSSRGPRCPPEPRLPAPRLEPGPGPVHAPQERSSATAHHSRCSTAQRRMWGNGGRRTVHQQPLAPHRHSARGVAAA